jgi:predicted unusual protein kinase regulating ubiquinone biosynthesis (AarF/ABC1/UbiB family)
MPRDMAVLAKSAATFEGIVSTLHPEIDLIALVRPLLDDTLRQHLSQQRLFGEVLGWVGLLVWRGRAAASR